MKQKTSQKTKEAAGGKPKAQGTAKAATATKGSQETSASAPNKGSAPVESKAAPVSYLAATARNASPSAPPNTAPSISSSSSSPAAPVVHSPAGSTPAPSSSTPINVTSSSSSSSSAASSALPTTSTATPQSHSLLSPEGVALSPQLMPLPSTVYVGQHMPFYGPGLLPAGPYFPPPYYPRPLYIYNPYMPRIPPPFPYIPPFLDHSGPPHFSIDVECSASGPTHNDRIVSQVALVDQNEKIVLNFFVKPAVPVKSTLGALTGISREDLDKGLPLEEGLRMLRAAVPKEAVLLGQNILMDIQWLGLVEGQDFASLLDLAGLFRVYNPKYRNYSYHSLQHKIKYLLGGEQYDTHNAATDAIWSVRLFNLFKRIEKDRELWGRCQEILTLAPPTPSFAALNPSLDGVCLGSRKNCTCGAPFFG